MNKFTGRASAIPFFPHATKHVLHLLDYCNKLCGKEMIDGWMDGWMDSVIN